ncbi:MAG: hypothetical protein AB1644_04930 [Candidatus Zixiibacteriota bacterium]
MPLLRTAVFAIAVAMVLPLFASFTHVGDCCDDDTTCNYLTCRCNCQAMTIVSSRIEHSNQIGESATIKIADSFALIEELENNPDHPPRFSA